MSIKKQSFIGRTFIGSSFLPLLDFYLYAKKSLRFKEGVECTYRQMHVGIKTTYLLVGLKMDERSWEMNVFSLLKDEKT